MRLAVPLSCSPEKSTASSVGCCVKKLVHAVPNPALRESKPAAVVGLELRNTPPSVPVHKALELPGANTRTCTSACARRPMEVVVIEKLLPDWDTEHRQMEPENIWSVLVSSK